MWSLFFRFGCVCQQPISSSQARGCAALGPSVTATETSAGQGHSSELHQARGSHPRPGACELSVAGPQARGELIWGLCSRQEEVLPPPSRRYGSAQKAGTAGTAAGRPSRAPHDAHGTLRRLPGAPAGTVRLAPLRRRTRVPSVSRPHGLPAPPASRAGCKREAQVLKACPLGLGGRSRPGQ